MSGVEFVLAFLAGVVMGPGLLQLFFADLGPPDARRAIATEQLANHRAKLGEHEEDQRLEQGARDAGPGQRTAERWHGETVRMGLLYERAAVDFWAGVAGGTVRPTQPLPGHSPRTTGASVIP